ncbi:hypothetical protein RN001_016351 [Aquatica leii]|uniref:Fanconi anaemia group A protein N-terminal domain-containing protein n=1 Tax=Aquatica leii TaxID=1421715 RepID=A0AAN7PP37_9COLE|nr:hypothetical protein RN001_016351 [Aquatica leii]
MDSESEDIFVSDVEYQLRSLSINNFVAIVDEVISNEYIDDGAALCFQVFYRITADSIYKNSFNGDYKDLNVVARCISRLQEVNKFDSILFLSYIISEFVTLPLEIVWWLHKNNVVYFIQYCEVMKLQNVPDSLLKFIKGKKQHALFNHKVIVEDLLEELLRCSCRPRTGIYRLLRSKTWESYSSDVLSNILDQTLQILFQDSVEEVDNFLCYMPNLNGKLPKVILKQFFKIVLTKILLHDVNEFDEYSAYTYQELWSSANINRNLFVVFEEIFAKHCSMEDIVTIMEESDDNINWKYALAAVSACVKVSPSGNKDCKDVASSFLNESFKGGKLKSFLKCLLFIRQGCMETTMKLDYQTWYSLTFGTKSNFKNKYNVTFFKFFMSSLTALIPYESKTYLKIQVDQALDAPLKCNSLIHDYKRLCRSRSQELKRSPSIFVDGGKVSLLHLIEESVRYKTTSRIMRKVVQDENLLGTILPQIVKKKPPFTTIKQILISENYLIDAQISQVQEDPNEKVFDESL